MYERMNVSDHTFYCTICNLNYIYSSVAGQWCTVAGGLSGLFTHKANSVRPKTAVNYIT